MPRLSIEDMVRGTQGALVGGDLGVPVDRRLIDSRTLAIGEVFFAILGHEPDGHAFLDDAAARGAACLVVPTCPTTCGARRRWCWSRTRRGRWAGSPRITAPASRCPWPR